MTEVRYMLAAFGTKGWIASLFGALGAAGLIGIPTVLVANPWFVRMTPVRPQDYAIWAASFVLTGLVVGTFAIGGGRSEETKTVSAGALSYLAVGCPVCNKIVVLLVGTSGALTTFAPLQLYLGVGSVLLLLWTLHLRARSLVNSCINIPNGGLPT